MYTANFIANSDYFLKHLLQEHVLIDEIQSIKLAYDIADDVVEAKNIISEYPRILSQMKNVGKFPPEAMLPIMNNIRLTRRPTSLNRTDLLHTRTRLEYIHNSATNFLIIAKPGIHTYKLAEQIQQKFHCVHIDCNDLVEQEIQSKSRLGIWLDKNLKLNKILPIEIILWLLQRETKSNKVLYRGYVLTGFPIIPNMDLNVQKNFLTEDEIQMFQQIIDELIDTPITNTARELAKLKKMLFSEYPNLEEDVDELKDDSTEETEIPKGFREVPKLFHKISCDEDVRYSIKRQLFFILDLENKPTSLIYLDCDDEDVIRKNIYFNKSSANELERIQKSLDRYNNALDVIQEFICYFPRPNVICCHGVYTLEETFESCCDKINEIGVRLVYLADDFYDTFKDDETIIETLETISDPNGILDILCKIKPIREDISWFRSSFENNCPVMMTQGKCVKGKYKHSARFIGSIYLLSSDENKRLFLENPQFFGNSFPTCRACIMGPRSSGKSTFARCLSKFFDYATIIEVNYLFEYYRKMEIIKLNYAQAVEQVISEMTTQLLDAYNKEKQIHDDKINDWIKTMTQYIIGFLKPIPHIKGKNKKPTPVKKAVHENERLRDLLNKFGFETDNPVKLKSYLTLTNLFFNKLPWDLRKNIIFREPLASDMDVKKLATERMNALSKDYKLPLARKIEILVTKIRLCEKRQKILTNGKKLYGYWILDGLPPDIELFQGLQEMNCLPDVIINMDDSVGERLAESQNTKCRREFYDINYIVHTIMKINKAFFNDKMNEIKEPTTESPKYFEAQLVRCELDHILMQDSLQGMKDFEEENGKYREDFESVKLFAESFDIQLIQLDIHNKSWSDAIIYGLRDYMNYFHGHPHILQDGFPKDEPGRILRVGVTAEYCPVLFVDKMLIKLGRSENAVQIKNKTYLFSTEEAMQTFVKNPFRYIDIERPFPIPPYRLCVIGGYHATKRGDLSRVADIIGTKYMSMGNLVNLYLNKTRSNLQLNVRTGHEIYEHLGDLIVNDIFAPLFYEGFLLGDIMLYYKEHLNITIISFYCLLLEDFPFTAEHLKQMISLNYYPEQIFFFKIENENLLNSETKYYENEYKNVLLKQVEAFKLQNENWMSQRRLRFNELFDQLPADIIVDEDTNFTDRLKTEILTDILNMFYVEADQNYQVQKRQLYVADMVNEEMPPDQYTKLIDEMMKLSIKQEVKIFLDNQKAEYEKIKLVANDNLIPFIQIRLHPYTTREIEKSILKYVKESTARQYLFDRAHPISYGEALDYIGYGQFMYTRYFRTCPVKNLDMNYPVKLVLRTTDWAEKVQPILYEEHIYFVQRESHNVEEFIDRPFHYTCSMNACQITFPIRLAVNGPRNSGCQALCLRISKEFQLASFTLDGMKEYVVKNFKWTKLATDLIENGMQITDIQQICDLVKISINFETQGWILRDIPLNDDLLNCFMLNGLNLNLVIYLEPTGMDLWSNIKNEYNKEKYKRKLEVLQHLYGMISELDNFSKHSSTFKGLTRNTVTIKNFTSRWSTWDKAYREILLLLRLYNLYERRGIQLIAGSLYKLGVIDYELEYRLSSLKLYCPMCWMKNKLLVKYNYHYLDDEETEPLYSDNMYEKNMFQFRKYFYWSCNNHLVELMVNAESYLKSFEEKLPEELPKLIKGWEQYMPLVNDGYCPVAYVESCNTNLLIGLPEYSVLYCNKVYAMSSQLYCIQFLQDPEKYKNVVIIFYNSNQSTVDEDFKNMKLDFGAITPTLITNALFECSFERPIHYNLEPGQSLEIYLALYLKTHNSNSSNSNIEAYNKMFLKYWDECRLMQRTLYQMQMTGNPYIRHTTKKKRTRVKYPSSESAFGF